MDEMMDLPVWTVWAADRCARMIAAPAVARCWWMARGAMGEA